MKKKSLFWLLLFVFLCNPHLNAQNNCIDLTDLYAPFIHCTYGSFWDPYCNQGVLPGRHTVMSQQGYDAQTQGQLPVIPSDETYSIRLGNSNTGAEAESIKVDITIDTNKYDLLILKYAAVLEDFGHASSDQPRFKLDILDTNNNAIDPDCLSMDFIANPSLGWHQTGIVLYKDWTSIGFDLTQYHGQTIQVRLTTFDCAEYRCFGYAYFLLTCDQKRITVSGCGDSEYTYSAPTGFHYDWYWQDTPSLSISNDQTVNVPVGTTGELGCHVSFIESPSCGFELFTSTERRFPVSAGIVMETGCPSTFDFINESFVSHDGIHPDGIGNPCDDILWNFGDGHTSFDPNPTHSYSIPGDYTVSLVAGLNNFTCTDTTYFEIHIPENTLINAVTCEPYVWDGDIYPESGVYHKSYPTATGCDSLVKLKLDANYSPSFTLQGDHWPVGGTELAWTQYTYDLFFDNPYCSVDSVEWSVDCPTMSVLPSDDGLSCELRIFSFLPANDSVPLRAIAHNRCGTVERTLWIHTSFYGVDEGTDPAVDVNVYPNPCSGRINIGMKGMAGETHMELYDSQGVLVDRWVHFNKSDDETLVYDGNVLGNGLFTLRVLYGIRSVTNKFMVSK